MDEAQNSYWFALVNEKGERTRFHFPTYRMAYQRAQLHKALQVWFDSDDGPILVDHISGQEAFGIGW